MATDLDVKALLIGCIRSRRLISNQLGAQMQVGKTALLLLKLQHDFLEPGGYAELLGNDLSTVQSIRPEVAKLLVRRFRPCFSVLLASINLCPLQLFFL